MRAIKVSIYNLKNKKNNIKNIEEEVKRRELSGWAECFRNNAAYFFVQGDDDVISEFKLFCVKCLDACNADVHFIDCKRVDNIVGFNVIKGKEDEKRLYCSLGYEGLNNIFIEKYKEGIFRESEQIQKIARFFNTQNTNLREMKLLLQNVPPGYMRQHTISTVSSRPKDVYASFSSLMASRTPFRKYIKKLTGSDMEWILNSKIIGASFAEKNGVRVPFLYQKNVSFSDIDLSHDCVIKPSGESGSKGVFVSKRGEIYEVSGHKKFGSLSEFKEYVMRLQNGKVIKSDSWNVEELLIGSDGKIPRDIKLYTFYGRVGVVLEIERGEETRYCFYNENLKPIRTGMYENEQLEPGHIPEIYKEIAVKISQEIPSPMIRIDLLKTRNGPVFGEFTPRPGNYEQFNPEIDRMLGEMFVEAEAKIFVDLLNDKKFDFFFK